MTTKTQHTEKELIILIEAARYYMEGLINEKAPRAQRAAQERRVNKLTAALRNRQFIGA